MWKLMESEAYDTSMGQAGKVLPLSCPIVHDAAASPPKQNENFVFVVTLTKQEQIVSNKIS